MTLVPAATQALNWKLLLKYENVSKDKVAAIVIGDFRVMLPHQEHILIPAYVALSIDPVEGAAVRRELVTTMEMSLLQKCEVLSSVIHDIQKNTIMIVRICQVFITPQ